MQYSGFRLRSKPASGPIRRESNRQKRHSGNMLQGIHPARRQTQRNALHRCSRRFRLSCDTLQSRQPGIGDFRRALDCTHRMGNRYCHSNRQPCDRRIHRRRCSKFHRRRFGCSRHPGMRRNHRNRCHRGGADRCSCCLDRRPDCRKRTGNQRRYNSRHLGRNSHRRRGSRAAHPDSRDRQDSLGRPVAPDNIVLRRCRRSQPGNMHCRSIVRASRSNRDRNQIPLDSRIEHGPGLAVQDRKPVWALGWDGERPGRRRRGRARSRHPNRTVPSEPNGGCRRSRALLRVRREVLCGNDLNFRLCNSSGAFSPDTSGTGPRPSPYTLTICNRLVRQ